jgi:phenylalanyl-tRNA synthetase alpha chain
MQTHLEQLKTRAIEAISKAESLKHLEDLKVLYLGKKGELTDILKGLATLPADQKPIIGQLANVIKTEVQSHIDLQKEALQEKEWAAVLSQDTTDTSLPSKRPPLGKKHPINQTLEDVLACFNQLGFSVQTGPDIETEHYNFEALNIPANHPARDMQDTFYLTTSHVLRTHTSPVQIRTMESQQPPIKIVVPGKVYRCDADVTHSPCFHQVEGLYVDKNVSFSELKGTLSYFLKAMFGAKRQVRFRPSYFPFTEPSTEVDVQCFKCSGKGCSLCKQTGWLEILGAGMVHRNVFRAVNYDPDAVTGFAFGLGIERIAMLRYEIQDIRLFFENDKRFLEQF